MARTPKRTSKEGIKTDIGGGAVQGVIGAQSVVIENLTFYSRAAEEPAQAAGAEPIGPCPYPGLAYFGPSDADLFFGRDATITRLAEAVGRQSFTALVGASGSGKSSVVLAGLAARLHNDRAGNWRFSHFRIGTELESNPFLALARALAPLYVASDSDVERLKNTKLLATSLAAGELTLRDVFADCRSRNKGRRILLIADQFEEAFTLVEDETIRSRFIDVLLAGFPDPAAGSVPDICLILTMRADFYGRALLHRRLADALQNHLENLGPMNREELQAAIVRPAENAGVAFEPGMVKTLLDTVASKPGGLPLLQFALREMWGRQERKRITRKSYDEIGGVEGALAQRAETVFAGLTKNGADPAMDKAFQRLFTRLVTLGEGQEDTRRVVEKAELGDEVWGLAQRLAGEENRLVVTNASSARETAEVVHEALIRHWPKLVDWINRDRAFQSWLRQIGAGTELWSADPQDDGPLLRGGMLAQATEWLAKRRDDLSQKERDFIEASIALRQRVEAEKAAVLAREHARLAEIEAGQVRTARIQRIAMGALAGVGLLVLAMLANVLWQQHDTDRREALVYTSLAAQAMNDEQFDRAMRFALQAYPARGAMPWAPFSTELEGKLAGGALSTYMHRVLRGHTGVVRSAAFSPDGKRVVTASGDSTARLWDTESGKEIAVLKGHTSLVSSAAFSPDGKRVVTASDDDTARLWDAESGKEIAVLKGHTDFVWSAAFSPDGKRVVTASGDSTARLWDTESGKEITVLKGHTSALVSAAFSPDGKRVVTASIDSTARLWDAESGNEVAVLKGHADAVASVAFSPDGKRVVTASFDFTARLWDAESGNEIAVLKGHTYWVQSAAFSPDGKRVVTASYDNTARLWDAESGKEIAVLKGHTNFVRSAAFSPDGKRVVTAADDTTARLWNAESGNEIAVLKGHANFVRSAAFSPDGKRVVTAADDTTARLWDAESGNEIAVLKGHANWVRSAAFSPDGKRVVTASSDTTARLWDAESGKEIGVLRGHTRAVRSAAFSPDGKRVVTASDDTTARLWDTESGKEIAVLKGHTSALASAAFSPDGKRVVTASDDTTARDNTARLWDAESGKEIAVLKGHTSALASAAFSPDGKRVVAASDDNTARLWDAESGKEIAVLNGHTYWVQSAAFSPDGKRVVTASLDATARLWDAESGKEIAVLKGHTGAVQSAAFSPDGKRVVTASVDTTARLWDVTWATLVRGETLRGRVCAEKLVGAAQEFGSIELEDPILRGVTQTNPCLRRGPLSLDYWTGLPAEWWASVRALF
jgi:WD40 repeat protein/ABC-type oligopeptide transport system ATPase subunit